MTFDRTQLEKDFREMIGPLCETVAPTGFEEEMADLVRDYLKGTGLSWQTDNLHNLMFHRPGKGPKVAVVAHLDEIGLIVRHIDRSGFLWIETTAGIYPQTLFGRHVIIKTDSGHVDGVVNHMNPGRPKQCPNMPADLSEFFIDIGAKSREEVLEMGVEVGNAVGLTYPTLFLGKDRGRVAAKALDDRACVYQLIELTRLLSGEEGCDFYAVFSTQEEVGGRGAIVAAENLRPDVVIALDMSLSTDLPGTPDRAFINRLGDGASIKVMDRSRGAACGLIADAGIVRGMKRVCKERNIPYQIEAYAAGATDASVMQTRGGGSRAGGVQIAMRYVHSYEMAQISDILDGVELLYHFVKTL